MIGKTGKTGFGSSTGSVGSSTGSGGRLGTSTSTFDRGSAGSWTGSGFAGLGAAAVAGRLDHA